VGVEEDFPGDLTKYGPSSGVFMAKNGPSSGVRMGLFPAENDRDSKVPASIMQSFFLTNEGILGGRRKGAGSTLLHAPPSSGVLDADDRAGELRLNSCSIHRYFGVCGWSSSARSDTDTSFPSSRLRFFGLFPPSFPDGIDGIVNPR